MNSNQDFLRNKLIVLRYMRSELVSYFLEESPEVFEPIWRYSRQPQAMELALHRFVLHWLNSHWEQFEIILNESEKSNHSKRCLVEKELLDLFYKLIENLCKHLGQNDLDTSLKAYLFIECAEELLMCVQRIINAHENSERSRNQLRTALYRHKELFQQRIDALNNSKG